MTHLEDPSPSPKMPDFFRGRGVMFSTCVEYIYIYILLEHMGTGLLEHFYTRIMMVTKIAFMNDP